MNLWEKFYASFIKNESKPAFYIGGKFYTYHEFKQYISGSQQLLQKNCGGLTGIPVGVVCHDSIETFAAIFAIWFSGCHFVPLHPLHPALVNANKIKQSGIELIFSSECFFCPDDIQLKYICNKEVMSEDSLMVQKEAERAYILFTSGSTGKPKGVPISVGNLNAFIEGFLELYPDLSHEDRFLQTYDLTSDAAFTGYLIPLLLGATVFTIPPDSIKYLSIAKMLGEHHITWTQFTPSVLNYLRPYFKSIRFDSLKHSHFGGEALPFDLVSEWAKCVPNSEVSNIYGPTETTITCTIYRAEIAQHEIKVYNGIISIGKPFKGVKTLITDDMGRVLGDNEKGELCIGGDQVMDGYINTVNGDGNSFLFREENGYNAKYYRSGDLVMRDEQGYLFFCGRIDDQLKISGYRIEPAEIEWAVSKVTGGHISKAFGYRTIAGTENIVLFVEKYEGQPLMLKEKLREFLSPALIPSKIISVGKFPLNSNGKVDKSRLFEEYSSQIYE
ncbi:MAG TPA: AMP-binding protein [Prolixibacteraceae bacterium]|jgi:amino acid adenylation domain-containing protein|nr:AMP-binding protein [Prolixibacteraceae bacterium]HQN92815.1 AMP-binding protein [Prolixibacteraceae bacterium]HUM88033.1 AMP-binding protein [Prolixibacteraceae bacterium]